MLRCEILIEHVLGTIEDGKQVVQRACAVWVLLAVGRGGFLPVPGHFQHLVERYHARELVPRPPGMSEEAAHKRDARLRDKQPLRRGGSVGTEACQLGTIHRCWFLTEALNVCNRGDQRTRRR